MTNSVTDSLQSINDALLSHNPFAEPPFLKAQHVWGAGFPDVKALNAHASDAVFQALTQIRQEQYSATSILITAQNGTGKTHIISRIRHQLQSQGGALFVYAASFHNLNKVKQSFQQLLADSLNNVGACGVTQWQELATAMANQAFKKSKPNAKDIDPQELISKFKKIANKEGEGKVSQLVDQLAKAFCKSRSVKDPDIVRAVFWTLHEDEASYATNWLAGKELAQYKANELKLPTQKQSFDAVLQILELISNYNQLVVCFDELDLEEFNDSGLHKSQIVAGLVKELFENLHRGVILTVMMPGTWSERVKQLPGGVWTKVRTQGDPLELKYMNGDSIVELVSLYLYNFYNSKNLIPPYPTYPFEEPKLRELGRQGLTIRQVLEDCRKNCQSFLMNTGEVLPSDTSTPQPTPTLLPSPVETAFTTELGVDIKKQLDDNYFLADALLYSFQTIVGQDFEGLKIKEATAEVGKRGGKDNYLNFKVIVEEDKRTTTIGVAVLQYEGGRALGAGFRRLLDSQRQFNLTRGCLVRSKDKPINAHFRNVHLNPLIEKGGEFVELKEDEIKPLVAIRAVYQNRTEYGVTEEDISKFIVENASEFGFGYHNPLLREILSEPSYKLPVDLQDEPEPMVETQLEDNNANNGADLAELIHA
jgi:AAA ATPase domain